MKKNKDRKKAKELMQEAYDSIMEIGEVMDPKESSPLARALNEALGSIAKVDREIEKSGHASNTDGLIFGR